MDPMGLFGRFSPGNPHILGRRDITQKFWLGRGYLSFLEGIINNYYRKTFIHGIIKVSFKILQHTHTHTHTRSGHLSFSSDALVLYNPFLFHKQTSIIEWTPWRFDKCLWHRYLHFFCGYDVVWSDHMIIVISYLFTICTLNIICCKVDKYTNGKNPFAAMPNKLQSRLTPNSKTSVDTKHDAKNKAQGFDRCVAQSYHPMR